MPYAVSLGLLALLGAGLLPAVEVPQRSGLGDKEFRHSDLNIETVLRLPAELPQGAGASLAVADLAALGLPADRGRLDARGGRWSALTPAHPLVPGSGVGNNLTWETLGHSAPANDAALRAAVAQAFRRYLNNNAVQLRIDTRELYGNGRTTVHGGGVIAQIYLPRAFNGIPVRDSYVTSVINHGNLVLLGTHKWGDIKLSTIPRITAAEALATVQAHVESFAIIDSWGKTELVVVPTARGKEVSGIRLGGGYGHRLAWTIRPSFAGQMGRWEALVDAHSGELISFADTNRYAEVKGGVYPVTNDGLLPDGVEQLGWPMPFQTVSTTSGNLTTDTGGNLAATGSMTATLSGPFVNINDNCGSDGLTQTDGIDWGGSGGTDCTTPGFGGPGNTHASRTGFYELNRIIEMGRSHLPSNTWLQQTLTSNMNINQTCNAFWGGGTVNFYRSGGGCFNTGEIAGVFDHEWGHGLDDNDANPTIASPSGEGIADIYTALRLNTSCIGRNFRATNCTGFGDPCLNCTGVRDIDYLQRQSGQPHDYSWSNANCGGSVHCVGSVYSEAVWSLWKRILQTAPYNYDNNTAHEITARMTFIGAGAVGTWFSGGPPFGGCGGSGGYLNYLAADDDNGNLNDGTPHMQAIFDAFNDQEIACATPTVQDSGCSGVPTTAPAVTTNPGNQQIGLSWGSVAGATNYNVYRAEGIFACDFGKVKIGTTAGTSFNDTGLQNGRDYSYVVIPTSSASCLGPASSCDTAQPASAPDFAVSCLPSSLSISQGGNDTSTCSVTSSGGYTGNVGLSCSGNPAGVSCSFAPTSVSPPANGSANSTLTVTVSGGQATGTFAFDVVGNDGANNRTSGMSITVSPAGSNGPQIAVYDGGLGAPKCSVAGSSCDSVTLLDSRDNLNPSEPNQPNTLDVCNDGTSGTYHVDESNDRIVVSTLDGGNFTEGDTVDLAATIWAWSTFTADTVDLYYAADANSPSWTFITSIVPSGTDMQTLTAQYVLPAGGMQAVRANFRYQGSASPCSTGTYDDHDDLVFAVEAAVQCVIDADCSDGAFCNGDETCNAGQCEAGTAPVCDNGDFCDGTETCNEATDSCDAGTAPCDPGTETCNEGTNTCEPIGCTLDSECDDGAFCNGAETCNVGTGACEAGTAPVCDDGLFCNGTESCNEGTDSCDAGTPPACDDGLFCNGTESCNEGTDSCDAGTAPVCDDGQFCNGTETCNEANDSCDAGTAPCTGGQTCNETTNICEGGATSSIWMSFRSNTVVPGVGTVTDEDIVSYDEVTGTWTLQFDGSDVGLGSFEIDGLAILPGGDLLLSFRQAGTVGGVSSDDSDVLRFTPTSLGSNTAGAFSLYFDGSDVGLTSNGEDLDGVALAADGRLIVSSQGGFSGSGASGADEDLFLFTGSLGPSTSGSFVKHFDGSDVGLSGSSSEDVDAAGFTAAGTLLFSTVGNFSVTGLSGADEDVAEFAGTFGGATSGTFSMRLDLSTLGINTTEDIGSLHIVE